MDFVNVHNITDKVQKVMAGVPDPRLRQISHSLIAHVHAFIREVQPNQTEFENACDFLVALGQSTGPAKNEVILLSDILGASSLINLLNDRPDGARNHHTDAALLGPFWRAQSPQLPLGANIARGQEAQDATQSLHVQGTVRDAGGQPLADAVVDVWQASPVGLYENQDPQQPDMNLRGRFKTDANGKFNFKSVRPSGYPVPVDGPCGDLLRAQLRDPYRPAHVHYMISKPGYQVLITQVFADDDHRLHTDVTFSVVESLVGKFKKRTGPGEVGFSLDYDFVLQAGEMHFPMPPIP
jgi:catechol 1,2-dioxygenase